MARRRINATERMAIFKRNGGMCHLCSGKIAVAELWEISHCIPLELGGADHGDNLKVAHKVCHRDHTAKVDVPAIAKAKRREIAHVGAKAAAARPIRSAPFPVSKGRKAHPMPALLPRRIYAEQTS